MSKLVERARHRNGRTSPEQVPLFDHAERVRVRSLPLPARRLAQRFGLSASTALAVALAAGFRVDSDK